MKKIITTAIHATWPNTVDRHCWSTQNTKWQLTLSGRVVQRKTATDLYSIGMFIRISSTQETKYIP